MKLSEIFNQNVTNQPILELSGTVFYIQPNDEDNTIEFGGCSNTGFFATDSFNYDFDMSWSYNFQSMVESMLEKYEA